MVKKIALEEHFLSPELEEYWWPTVKGVDPAHAKNLHARLADFGDMRLQSMDQAGIARSVLAIAGQALPGRLMQADLRSVPLAAASLDGIWCCAAMLHVPEDQTMMVLNEFRRVLRPGGAPCVGMR